jgi:hypothetical protein
MKIVRINKHSLKSRSDTRQFIFIPWPYHIIRQWLSHFHHGSRPARFNPNHCLVYSGFIALNGYDCPSAGKHQRPSRFGARHPRKVASHIFRSQSSVQIFRPWLLRAITLVAPSWLTPLSTIALAPPPTPSP